MRHIGITGSRDGLSGTQQVAVLWRLALIDPGTTWFHHGDCVGVDAQIHEMLTEHGHYNWIEVHPPSSPRFRAFCAANVIHAGKPYLKRDLDIVKASEEVWAFPSGSEEKQPRSGTWATVRMARVHDRKLRVFDR